MLVAVGKLEAAGLLVDTGERKGKTRQVKVYRIEMKDAGNGFLEGGRKGEVSESGRVPVFPPKDAVFEGKGCRFSDERVPDSGYGSVSESSSEVSGDQKYARDACFVRQGAMPQAKRFVPLGYLVAKGVDADVAGDWLAMRKAKRAEPTKTAIEGIAGEAARAGMCLEEALRICCANGWQGFRADWVVRRGGGEAGGSHYDRNMAAVARARKLIFGGQDV